MERTKVICPYCGYRMPIEVTPNAVAKGLYVKCKGRSCGKVFEIIFPQPPEEKTE